MVDFISRPQFSRYLQSAILKGRLVGNVKEKVEWQATTQSPYLLLSLRGGAVQLPAVQSGTKMKFLRSLAAKAGSSALRRGISGVNEEEIQVDLSTIRGIRAQYRHSGDASVTREICGTLSPPSPLVPELLPPTSLKAEAGTRRKVDVRPSRRKSVDMSRSDDLFTLSEVLQEKSSERTIKLTSTAPCSSRKGSLTESGSSISLDGSEGQPDDSSSAASTPKASPTASEARKSLTLILPSDTSSTSTLDWEPAQDLDCRRSPGNQATPYGAYFTTSNSQRSTASVSPMLPWPSPAPASVSASDREGFCGSLLYGSESIVPEPRRDAPQNDEDACVYLTEEVRYLQDQIWRVQEGLPTQSTLELDTTRPCVDVGDECVSEDHDNFDEEFDDSSVDIEQELRELEEEQKISEEASRLNCEILWLRTEVVAFRQLLTELEVKAFLKEKAEHSDPAAAFSGSRKPGWEGRRAIPKLQSLLKGELMVPSGPLRARPFPATYNLDVKQAALLGKLLIEMQEECCCIDELCKLHKSRNLMVELDLLCNLQELVQPERPPNAHIAPTSTRIPLSDGAGRPPAKQDSAILPPPSSKSSSRKVPWSRMSQSMFLLLHSKHQEAATEGPFRRRSQMHSRSMSVDDVALWDQAMCKSNGGRTIFRPSPELPGSPL